MLNGILVWFMSKKVILSNQLSIPFASTRWPISCSNVARNVSCILGTIKCQCNHSNSDNNNYALMDILWFCLFLMRLQKKPEFSSVKLLLNWIKHSIFMKEWKSSKPPSSKGIICLKQTRPGLGYYLGLLSIDNSFDGFFLSFD